MTKPSMPQEHANHEKMPTSISDIVQATLANPEWKLVLATENQELSKAEQDLLSRMGDASVFGVEALAKKIGLSEAKSVRSICSMGMGCEDAGFCYAAAMNCPERCGKE